MPARGKACRPNTEWNLLVANFNAIDKANADGLLKWKSLFFNDMRVGYNPLAVDIRQIALADFFVRLIVYEGGTMNLQNILVEKATAVKETPPATGQMARAVPVASVKSGNQVKRNRLE